MPPTVRPTGQGQGPVLGGAMKRKKRRKPTRPVDARRPVPISTVRLQLEVERLRELQDQNAVSHTHIPPSVA